MSTAALPDVIEWNTFYSIPLVHYSPRVVEQLPPRAKARWNHCLAAFAALEAQGLSVHLVPLSYDHDTGGWWMDYVDDYVANAVAGGAQRLEKPHLNVVLKIDDEGHLLWEKTVYIYHDHLQPAHKTQIQAALGRFPWFVWNGKASRTMEIHLTKLPRKSEDSNKRTTIRG